VGSTRYLRNRYTNFGSFNCEYLNLVRSYDQQQLEVFVVVARRIWLRRNEIVLEQNFTDPIQLYAKAITGLEDFHKSNTHSDDRRDVEQSNPVVTWIPPSRDMVKINFDATLDSKNRCVGLGLLARDEQGHFLVACGLH
jgi:hypothetical protein